MPLLVLCWTLKESITQTAGCDPVSPKHQEALCLDSENLEMSTMRLFYFALLMLGSLATPAAAAEWISSTSLEGFVELSAADRRRIAPLVGHRIIGYSFADNGIEWRIHSGDLKIAGNFDNESALIVDGSLEIAGSYDDYGAGSGLLIVLGDLSAEHVLTWNGLFVRGKVKATGLLYGVYNDYAFEAGGGVGYELAQG